MTHGKLMKKPKTTPSHATAVGKSPTQQGSTCIWQSRLIHQPLPGPTGLHFVKPNTAVYFIFTTYYVLNDLPVCTFWYF